MPTFGKRSNQRPQGAGGGYEMYLKTFDDGQSKIAILEDDPSQWVDFKEHFDFALKISFPCAAYEEPGTECIGCNYPVEHPEYADLDTHFPGVTKSVAKDTRKKLDKGWGVRDVTSRWIFPCIDAKDYISIYKIGFNLWEEFKGHYEILGSVTAQEFVIKRTGKGFDTTTQAVPVPGEVRKPKYPVPGMKEISETLGKKYAFALEKYGFEVPTDSGASTPADVANEVDPANAGPAGQPNTGPAAPEEPKEPSPTSFIPREASAGEIKDWLEKAKVEFPAKAPRQVLVGLAEKKLVELQGEPPF